MIRSKGLNIIFCDIILKKERIEVYGENEMSDLEKVNLRKREKALSILGNELRLKILYLLRQEKNKLNFNEIADKLNIKRNKLAYHVALLKNNNFIANEMRPEKEKNSFSYYGITKKGNDTIDLIEKMNSVFEKDEAELEKILD